METIVTNDSKPSKGHYIEEYDEREEEYILSDHEQYGLRPDTPMLQHHREFCRLLAHGVRNKEICRRLKMTPAWVSTLKRAPKIKKEVAKLRDRLFSVDIEKRFSDLSVDAMDVLEEILVSPHISAKDKENAAKWVLEKTTGKPAQQVDHKHEGSIGLFLQKLDQQKGQEALEGDSGSETVDVTPKEVTESKENASTDAFSAWLDKNLESS